MKSVTFKFECGDEVRDRITGWLGTVVTQQFHLNACVRYAVQPKMDPKDPIKMPDVYTFDEDQLEMVNAIAVALPEKRTGFSREARPAR